LGLEARFELLTEFGTPARPRRGRAQTHPGPLRRGEGDQRFFSRTYGTRVPHLCKPSAFGLQLARRNPNTFESSVVSRESSVSATADDANLSNAMNLLERIGTLAATGVKAKGA
jgi:hypothetical protein